MVCCALAVAVMSALTAAWARVRGGGPPPSGGTALPPPARHEATWSAPQRRR